MPELAGKNVVITGGSRGIGAASARAIARCGGQVILTYLQSAEPARAVARDIVAAGGKAEAVQLDATSEPAVAAFAQHVRNTFGHVDALFNNAGDLVSRANLDQITVDLYRKVFDLNVLSTVLVTQALLPLMGRGSIVINMSSVAARNGGGVGAGLYAASKGAVLTLTRNWAKEFAPRGIRVVDVAPGVIETDFHKRHSTPEVLQRFTTQTVLGRLGTSEEVGEVVAFLASDGSSYLTGQTIDVNGGIYLPH